MKTEPSLEEKLDGASMKMHSLRNAMTGALFLTEGYWPRDVEYTETDNYLVSVIREGESGSSIEVALCGEFKHKEYITIYFADKKEPWEIERLPREKHTIFVEEGDVCIERDYSGRDSFKYVHLKYLGGDKIELAWADESGKLIDLETFDIKKYAEEEYK